MFLKRELETKQLKLMNELFSSKSQQKNHTRSPLQDRMPSQQPTLPRSIPVYNKKRGRGSITSTSTPKTQVFAKSRLAGHSSKKSTHQLRTPSMVLEILAVFHKTSSPPLQGDQCQLSDPWVNMTDWRMLQKS